MPKLKNIIIFIAIAVVIFAVVYFAFLKPAPTPEGNLVSSNSTLPNVNNSGTGATNPSGTASTDQDFLPLLLNIKNIQLKDDIFTNPAFISLHDSSIPLVQDGTEGRTNPFAQFGNDNSAPAPVVPPTCKAPQVLNTATNTCVTPAVCTAPKILDTATNTCVTPPPVCTATQILITKTNTCVTKTVCTAPKILDTSNNTCVKATACPFPKVYNKLTNTCDASVQ